MDRCHRLFTACLAAVATAFSAAGCTKTLGLLHYPDFYTPELDRVAVTPFEAASADRETARRVTLLFADALARNGTYDVIGPDELADRLGADAADPARDDPERLAAAAGELRDVDAVLTGSVSVRVRTWSGWAYPPVRRHHVGFGYPGASYAYRGYPYGRRHYRDPFYDPYYDDYPRRYAGREAAISVRVEMVRVPDGRVLHRTPTSIEAAAFAEGVGPPERARTLMRRAAEGVNDELLWQFAVVPIEVEVDPDETLVIARPGPHDRLDSADTFTADEDEMVVAVRLPDAADRNAFTLEITRETDDREEVLASREFTWTAGEGSREFVFSPRDLAREGGTGEYHVQLLTRGERALRRDFDIKPVEEPSPAEDP